MQGVTHKKKSPTRGLEKNVRSSLTRKDGKINETFQISHRVKNKEA